MIGCFLTYIAISSLGLPAWIAVLLSVIVCTVLGILIEKVADLPLREAASSLAVLITAIGVSYLLQNVALLIFGANAKTFPSVIKWKGISVAGGVAGMYLLCMSGGVSGIYLGDKQVFLGAICSPIHILDIDKFSSADSMKMSCIQFIVIAIISAFVMMFTENVTFAGI